MPVSKHRKGHAKKALQRKNEIIQYRNRMDKAYKAMFQTLRDKSTSMTDMLNKEDKLPKETDLANPDSYRSDTENWKVIDAPEFDPNEPISIASQWQEQSPEQQAINESGVLTTTTND